MTVCRVTAPKRRSNRDLTPPSRRLAARLKEAEVPHKLTVYDGINHGFIRYGRLIATARRAIADCAGGLRKALVATA